MYILFAQCRYLPTNTLQEKSIDFLYQLQRKIRHFQRRFIRMKSFECLRLFFQFSSISISVSRTFNIPMIISNAAALIVYKRRQIQKLVTHDKRQRKFFILSVTIQIFLKGFRSCVNRPYADQASFRYRKTN